ncbi:MAG: polysaccharide biosynthesis/export family protein [Bacteroidota bacterium]
MIRKLLLILPLAACFSACNINPSVMFKTDSNYSYANDQTIGNVEYRISPNDIIGFSVYSNDGQKLVDLTTVSSSLTSTSGGNTQSSIRTLIPFAVEPDGLVKLPIIGKIKIKDLTVREAEKMLEQQYSTYYVKPFVTLQVLNRRVMVFPGLGGAGRVINITNENTTLIEALAMAGGIAQTGKAKKIKLIRGDTRNPQVMLIDLSTIEGMKQTNLMLQANDIIYVEPVPRVSQEVLAQITPIVGIITSFLLIYNIVVGFNNTNNN